MSTESLVVIIPTLVALLAVVVALFALLVARSRDGQPTSGAQSLEQLLAAPTLRGGVGELVLENMLSQTLPTGSYETQYALRNGNRVDAVIRLADGLVPVDAKFPLESFSRLVEAGDSGHGRRLSQFRRDMRRHVDDIADKYILPGETLDFALMYIPAENVYYETVLKDGSDEDILDYAWKRRVFPTSPNSFFAFLADRGARPEGYPDGREREGDPRLRRQARWKARAVRRGLQEDGDASVQRPDQVQQGPWDAGGHSERPAERSDPLVPGGAWAAGRPRAIGVRVPVRAACMASFLGRVEYPRALELQRSLHRRVADGLLPNVLLLMEHPHVYTLGRRGVLSDVLASPEELEAYRIEVHHVDRGGEVTYHGPGQLVAYPIVDVRRWGGGPLRYVRKLEEVVVTTVADFGIRAGRDDRPTGVWVGDAKLAAIGVKISGGVTTHGLALNVDPDLSHFDRIVPCGMPGVPVTSMSALASKPIGVEEVAQALASCFGEAFGWPIEWEEPELVMG